jgi:hypothetical protein
MEEAMSGRIERSKRERDRGVLPKRKQPKKHTPAK